MLNVKPQFYKHTVVRSFLSTCNRKRCQSINLCPNCEAFVFLVVKAEVPVFLHYIIFTMSLSTFGFISFSCLSFFSKSFILYLSNFKNCFDAKNSLAVYCIQRTSLDRSRAAYNMRLGKSWA